MTRIEELRCDIEGETYWLDTAEWDLPPCPEIDPVGHKAYWDTWQSHVDRRNQLRKELAELEG